MAIRLRTRFKLILAKLQDAETQVAERALVARAALRELASAELEADKLDDRIGELLGLRLAYYSDRLEIANAGGSDLDTSEAQASLKTIAGHARRFVAASRLLKVEKLFRSLGVDEDDEESSDDDDDDGSSELEAADSELEDE